MDYLIAPTLFQNKICRLPGIGTLEIIVKSAETFFGHQEILAPKPSITFKSAIDDEHIFNEFTALSEVIKRELFEKRIVALKGIGNFILTNEENIEFEPIEINNSFVLPVVAERVVRQDVEHLILVGDKEVTTTVMADYYEVEAKAKIQYKWWVAAVILAVVAIVAIVIYISTFGVNSFGKMF